MKRTRFRITLCPALAVVALMLGTTALPALGNHYILCGDNSKCEPPPLPPAPPPPSDEPVGESAGKANAAIRYIATRIPTQLLRNTTADAINQAGDIVGAITRNVSDYFWGDEQDIAAFVFSANNVFTPIQTPGSGSHAYGVNGKGDVVGVYSVNGHGRAFRFSQGLVADLPLPGAQDSAAMAINEAGDIAGTKDGRAFILSADGHLEAVPYDSYGNAINAFGDGAGFLITSRIGDRTLFHALRYGGGTVQDLGSFSDYAYAFGINADGDVVGQSFGVNGPSIPFLYTNGAMHAIGDMNGTANAINSAGTIVGSQYGTRGSQAFIYMNGEIYKLSDLVDGLDGVALATANAINDAGQIAARSCSPATFECFGVRLDPVPVLSVPAVEFYHAGMNHYFMTADPGEIAKLDDGTIAGWARTGEEFAVKPGPQVGTAPVCRFFSASFAPQSSHFYTPSATECAIVKRNSRWNFEGIVFYATVPDADGACPSGQSPVYRLYNAGQGGAPNHRYTTSTTIRDRMIAQGWIPEGNGPLGVAMCSTPD